MRRLLSSGNTPPSTTFDTFFRCAPCGTLHPRRVAADASLFALSWCRPCGRRTTHPSGSRRLDVSPPGQTSAPGLFYAPENRQFPAASNRVPLTNDMAPSRGQFHYGSRPRRRQTQQCGGRLSVRGRDQDESNGMVVNHFSYPSLTSTPWWLDLSQKLCGHQRAPGLV
jgi:hypothetical protein